MELGPVVAARVHHVAHHAERVPSDHRVRNAEAIAPGQRVRVLDGPHVAAHQLAQPFELEEGHGWQDLPMAIYDLVGGRKV